MSVNDFTDYPKRLLCRLTQTGVLAPVISSVIINTLGVLPVMSYSAVGSYVGAFPLAVMKLGQSRVQFWSGNGNQYLVFNSILTGSSATNFTLTTNDPSTGNGADGGIGSAAGTAAWLEIMVYP